MLLILATRCGIEEEIQELALLNANPVNMPTINQNPILPIDTGNKKKAPKCARVKIAAVTNTLILGAINFLMYC